MKITIVIEHEDHDTCIVHEASGFQEAIAALESMADVALSRRAAQHGVQADGVYCTHKVFIPSTESSALVCRSCGKPRR